MRTLSTARTWMLAGVVVLVACTTTAALEAVLMADDEWQYLGTVIITWLGVTGWAAAGAVVLLTTPARRRWPKVETITTIALLVLIVGAVAMWLSLVAVGISDVR